MRISCKQMHVLLNQITLNKIKCIACSSVIFLIKLYQILFAIDALTLFIKKGTKCLCMNDFDMLLLGMSLD